MSGSCLDRIRDSFSRIRGADYADMYVQGGVSHSVTFEDGRMDTLSSSRGDGLGVRVVIGDNSIYSHTFGTTASSAAVAIAEAADMSGVKMASPAGGGDEPLLEIGGAVPSIDVSFFHDLDRMLRDECKYLRQATFRYRTSLKSILIVRLDGSIARDERAYTTFAASVVLERDGALETGYEVRSLKRSEGEFWSALDSDCPASPEGIARAALSRGVAMLDAVPCPAGRMMVLMDGTAGGTMIHEACGHGLEADIIQKDFSTFRGKLGEAVASQIVTIVDDATVPYMYGSYGCDDEGVPAQRTVLVEGGVLKNYLTDIQSARLGSLPLTGNGRRESYQHIPLPRMSNTFIEPGASDYGEMLAGVGCGIAVKKMGGGEVNPTSGDFVFNVTEGYLIEDGRLGPMVRGATLAGNGPEALWNIVAVGKKLVLDPGTCGKSGQGVPVTDGQPTILIKNLTVGGRDTGDAD